MRELYPSSRQIVVTNALKEIIEINVTGDILNPRDFKIRTGAKEADSSPPKIITILKTVAFETSANMRAKNERAMVVILTATYLSLSLVNKSRVKVAEELSIRESAVDMVDEKRPAKMTPTKKSGSISFESMGSAISYSFGLSSGNISLALRPMMMAKQ